MLTTAHTNTWVVHMYDECDSVTPPKPNQFKPVQYETHV